MEHMDDNQKREEKLIFAMQFIDNAKEQLNDLVRLTITAAEQRNVDIAFARLNDALKALEPVRKPYSLKAELKEIINSSCLVMHRIGGQLNTLRRKASPHRDPV